jgi:putative transposase
VANTYTSLYVHLVFSTKNREPWIDHEIENRIWSYLGGIAKENSIKTFEIGGMPDHVHLVLALPPTISVSKSAQLIKGGSSLWIKSTFPEKSTFAWQDGYGAFTISKSNLDGVIKYVRNQREHHRVKTFQEEYTAFLERHGVEYNPTFLWG